MKECKSPYASIALNLAFLLLGISACQGSNSQAAVPFWGNPELSDFGDNDYLVNKVEELDKVSDVTQVKTLSQTLSDPDLCSFALSEEQIYNPYKQLDPKASNWFLEKTLNDIDYQLSPTLFSHIKIDYWKKVKVGDDGDGNPNYDIQYLKSECYAPAGWQTRSPRIELGVNDFAKKYADCLHPGLPDPTNIDNCQDGMEVIGGLTHRIRSTTLNKHRFRVSWWLKKPDESDEETQKIRDMLKIPYRIPLTINSIFSELSETDDYRVRALAFSEESATDLPRYWLIPDEGGQNRVFLPLHGVDFSSDTLDARSKLKEINRPDLVANFTGHFAWDRSERRQVKSTQLPVSRFMDDQIYPLWKKLRSGSNLKVQLIFRATESDDIFLEEFLLESSGKLTLKKVKQLNAYGTTDLGLPTNSHGLDANGLEIYND